MLNNYQNYKSITGMTPEEYNHLNSTNSLPAMAGRMQTGLIGPRRVLGEKVAKEKLGPWQFNDLLDNGDGDSTWTVNTATNDMANGPGNIFDQKQFWQFLAVALGGSAIGAGMKAADAAALGTEAAGGAGAAGAGGGAVEGLSTLQAGSSGLGSLGDYTIGAGKSALFNTGSNAIQGKPLTQGLGRSILMSGLGTAANATGVTSGISDYASKLGLSPEVASGVAKGVVKGGLSTLGGLTSGQGLSNSLKGGVTAGVGSGIGSTLTNYGVNPTLAGVAGSLGSKNTVGRWLPPENDRRPLPQGVNNATLTGYRKWKATHGG